jgi:crotonobetainyl-CoA:carnitine CoA-transferase CaiB-like acyl-CoA transferase
MTRPQLQPAQPMALGHIRVLDLSRVLAGPWAAQLLADLGADVVKVENPDGGDDTRGWGPPFMEGPDGERGDAAYYTCANRNKRSITIDFAKPEGADLVRGLAAKADIVIENLKPGGLARYGLDYAGLSAVNPRLIYCSITGFGQTGPYRNRPGYDFLIQGMGGLMSFTGQPDGTPGAEPMKAGVAVCDLFTGMYAATAILAALVHRDRTGEGQYIDCSLLDSQVAMLANQGANWLVGGRQPDRMGNNHPSVVPYRVFPASDGHIILACGNDRQFERLCVAFDVPEWAEDRRFKTNAARVANREEIDARIAGLFQPLTRAALIEKLEAANVPAGPINGVPDVFADPHVEARGTTVPLTRRDGTEIATVAYPAKLSATPASYRSAPPLLGEDSADVLADWAGYDEAKIGRLKDRGVV